MAYLFIPQVFTEHLLCATDIAMNEMDKFLAFTGLKV